MSRNAIVVGIDGSPAAQSAMLWAVNECRIRRCDLVLLHAGDWSVSELPAPLREPAVRAAHELDERMLRTHAAAASTRQPGIAVMTKLSHARAADALIELSGAADMIVVGTRGRGGIVSTLLGSVSHRVAAHAHCPVAVVPETPQKSDDPRQRARIVVGVSSALSGKLALRFGFEEAQRRNSVLVAALAWNAVDQALLLEVDPVVIERSKLQARQRLDADLAELRSTYPDVVVEPVIMTGEPSEVLLGAARDAELIVVGCHHSKDRWSTRLGPVPSGIVHRSPCPVIVIGQQQDGHQSLRQHEAFAAQGS